MHRDLTKARSNELYNINIQVCTTKIIWDEPTATNKLIGHRKKNQPIQNGVEPTTVRHLIRTKLEPT